jgi:hypothetical protein
MPCCMQTNGLGQLDPATLLAIDEAFVHMKDLWNNLKQIFGIGVGAHEADVIVPLQNQITTTVLAPISDFLTQVKAGTIHPTCTEYKTWLSQLTATETKWLDYLHKTQWADGRAAQQAEATLKPYFTAMKSELQAGVTAMCGITGGILTNPDGTTNWPIIALAGGALFMLTRRKG